MVDVAKVAVVVVVVEDAVAVEAPTLDHVITGSSATTIVMTVAAEEVDMESHCV